MKILVLAALREEFSDKYLKGDDVVEYTGVGKALASAATTRAIIRHKPDLILNLGTAGARIIPNVAGAMHRGRYFVSGYIDDDISVGKLNPEDPRWPPFRGRPTAKIEEDLYDLILKYMPEAPLKTSDRFLSFEEMTPGFLHDMEYSAIVFAIDHFGIPVLSIKYVSDSGSADEWRASLPRARRALKKAYNIVRECYGKSRRSPKKSPRKSKLEKRRVG